MFASIWKGYFPEESHVGYVKMCIRDRVSDVHLGVKKIAGVRVPLLENVEFEIRPYSMFNAPKWYADGIDVYKRQSTKRVEPDSIPNSSE